MDVRLKYVWEDKDRHGNVRLYVAMPGRKKVRIRAAPGSPEFMGAYQEAIKEKSEPTSAKGTFANACEAYYASKVFKRLDESTQGWRARELDRLCAEHGPKSLANLRPRHIRKLRDECPTPTQSNQRLKALRALFQWLFEQDMVEIDPTANVKRLLSPDTGGHHTWTLDEVIRFEERHAIGTKARLAMTLLVYTACRREDVVRFGPEHIVRGRVIYTQAKNESRRPIHMDIPVHKHLQLIIDKSPHGNTTFVATEQGRPYTPMGFSDTFRKWVAEAGLPQRCTPHGLRKATAAVLAERGASMHEIQAILGHRTLQEVERYTRAAARKKLADSAMKKLPLPSNNPPTDK